MRRHSALRAAHSGDEERSRSTSEVVAASVVTEHGASYDSAHVVQWYFPLAMHASTICSFFSGRGALRSHLEQDVHIGNVRLPGTGYERF